MPLDLCSSICRKIPFEPDASIKTVKECFISEWFQDEQLSGDAAVYSSSGVLLASWQQLKDLVSNKHVSIFLNAGEIIREWRRNWKAGSTHFLTFLAEYYIRKCSLENFQESSKTIQSLLQNSRVHADLRHSWFQKFRLIEFFSKVVLKFASYVVEIFQETWFAGIYHKKLDKKIARHFQNCVYQFAIQGSQNFLISEACGEYVDLDKMCKDWEGVKRNTHIF